MKLEDYKADSRGRLIPIASIKPIDQERDDLVYQLVQKAQELNGVLREFRRAAHGDIQAFVDLSSEKYKVQIGGEKGNISLLSFDGRYKILRAVNDVLVFDERLQAAKALIDQCIREWSAGSGKEIQTLVNNAFQVDQQGNINTKRVLELRRLDFDHPKWKQAMEAISDSLLVATSRTYLRFYERDDATGKYQQINLDLANA